MSIGGGIESPEHSNGGVTTRCGRSARAGALLLYAFCIGASVCSAQPSIGSFTASPNSLNPGTVTRLSWSAANATSLTIDLVGDTTGLNSTDVIGRSFLYQAPTQTTSYRLTASNGTDSVTQQVTVTVTDTAPPGLGTGTMYFVSPTGNDANNGMSPANAWQTVAHVNGRTFNPGDSILFQRGGEWHESLIVPSDGAPGNPITFADYGSGAKPKFWGSVVLNNSSFQSLGGGIYSYSIATPVLSALVNHVFFYYNASNNAANMANSWSYSANLLQINSPNSDPRTDGKVYTAVVRQDVVFSNSHNHLIFRDLVVDESAAFGGGYAFRIQNSTDVLVDSSEAYRAGKHHFATINSTQFVGENLYAAWAMPGQGYGGASAYVSFGDATVSLINQTSVWQNCVFDHPQNPQEGFNYYALLMHGSNIGSVTANNLSSLGGNLAVNNGENLNATITVHGGLIQNGRLEVYGEKVLVDGMHITGPYGSVDLFGSYSTLQNLLLEGSYLESDGFATAIISRGNGNTVRFSTIVLDARAAANYSCVTLDNNSSNHLVGGAFFTFYGNICISTGTNLKQWDPGTPLNSDLAYSAFNFYGPNTVFRKVNGDGSYNNLNLSDWNALGLDGGSAVGNPLFQDQPNSNYNLLQGSPAIDLAPLSSSLLTDIPAVPFDNQGTDRLQGVAFDAGALESPYTGPGPVGISVSPSVATLGPGEKLQLSASLSGTSYQQINWSVTSGQGSVTPSGLYTAPSGILVQQSVTITAASATFPAKVATVNVTVIPIVVSVAPGSPAVYPGQLMQFAATVSGASNKAVIWTVLSGPGTITAAGLYTAPASVNGVQQALVRASSTQDSTKVDTATITINPGSPTYQVSATAFGALGDAIMRTDGLMNAGSPVLTSQSGSFGQADVGKYIQVVGAGHGGTSLNDGTMQAGSTLLTSNSANFTSADRGRGIAVLGAGANGGILISSILSIASPTSVNLSSPAVSAVLSTSFFYGAMTLEGTILSVESSTSITLSTAAAATISGAQYAYGTDDHVAFQAAVDAVGQAGGGTVIVPQPASCLTGAVCGYMLNTTDQMTSHVPGAVKVRYSNITLAGVAPQTNLFCRGAWATYTNSAKFPSQTATIRGNCLAIGDDSGPNGVAGEVISNVTIKYLHLYGMTNGNTQSTSFDPVSASLTTTGDGWDITQKAIFLYDDSAFSNIIIDSIAIQDFKSENIFSAGSAVTGMVISNSSISNFNGDGISVLAKDLQVLNNTITNGSNAGIENAVFGGTDRSLIRQLYQSNIISQMAGEAITINGDDNIVSPGVIQIINNQFDTIGQFASSLARTALYIVPLSGGNATPANVTITGNTCHDCYSFGILQTGGNVQIANNTFIVDRYNAYNFLSFTFPFTNVTVQNNTGNFTSQAIANSVTLHAIYELNPGYSAGNFAWNHLVIGGNNWNFPGTPNYEFVTSSGMAWGLVGNKNITWLGDICVGCTYPDQDHGVVSLAPTNLIRPYGPVVVVKGNAAPITATVDASKEEDGSLVQIVNSGTNAVTFNSDANLSLASPVTVASGGGSTTFRYSSALGKFVQGGANQVAAPSFSLPSGSYAGAQLVSLNSVTPGASIRYTTDGTIPSMSVGTLYTGVTISVNVSTVITAIAYKTGLIGSPVVSASYIITPLVPANLGTSSMVIPPIAGSNSVLISGNGPWTASTSDTWLHLQTVSGASGAVVPFSHDANSGATRTGTIRFNGGTLTLTVTQAGTSYVTANFLTTLVTTGLSYPKGVAVSASGEVYITDAINNAVYKWQPSTNQLIPLIVSGLAGPENSALDSSGNLFIGDFRNNVVKKWTAATNQLTTIISSGLNLPSGVALDTSGNLYIADTFNNQIKEWNPSTQQITTLVSSGLNVPKGVAVDILGNVYIADGSNNAVEVWDATTHNVTTLVSTGLHGDEGVAVDGSGNVYIGDGGNHAIKKWSASTQQVTTVASEGLVYPHGMAVDAAGNVYIGDSVGGAVRKLTFGFVGPATLAETANAGSDSLLPVLPAGIPLTASSDQPWLTIGTVVNGVVNFTFAANTTPLTRTAHIRVLGQDLTITQNGNGVADFNIVATPGTQATLPTGGATYTVTTNVLNGFAGTVNLAVSGLPAGASAGFNIPSIPGGAGVSTLTVTTSAVSIGSYPLTISATSGALSHTINATLVVQIPDFTVTAPASQSVFQGSNANYPLTVSALGGFAGAVNFGVTGLPAGATSTFNPLSISGSGPVTLNVTTLAGTAPGIYPLTITATSGALSHTANATLVVNLNGSLTGALATPTGVQTLSTSGTTDWAHWGLTTPTSFDHKSGVTQQISNYSIVGGAAGWYGDNPIGFTWTGGTPTATTTNSTTGVWIAGLNNGLYFTVPADTTSRTLQVYVGVWQAGGKLVAHLSDGSSADYVSTGVLNNGGKALGLYTLTYSAASSGQTLSVTYTMNSGAGNVTLQAATLSTAPAADFNVGSTPGTQSVAPGVAANYNVSVSALNGFAGNVNLAVSALPTGATAGFTPTSISGGAGSSALAVTTTGVAAGTYPLTITASSGALSHTASATLTVQAPDFAVAASPGSQSALPTGGASYTVSVAALSGFAGTVNLAVSGLPTGATATFTPTSVSGAGSSTLAVTTNSVAIGSYPLTITATSGTLSHTANATLVIQTPDFSVAATPPSQSILPGGSTNYTVTVSALSGFSGTLSFSVTGLPAGATPTFNPVTVNGGGPTTLTLATLAGAAPGSYPLTITATSGALSHTANATLVVNRGGSLTGALATPTGVQNLTTSGTIDWAHWGLTTPTSFDHKSGVTPQISNYTQLAEAAN